MQKKLPMTFFYFKEYVIQTYVQKLLKHGRCTIMRGLPNTEGSARSLGQLKVVLAPAEDS